MRHRKGTFKPASARSKKAALAASEDESRQLAQDAYERREDANSGPFWPTSHSSGWCGCGKAMDHD